MTEFFYGVSCTLIITVLLLTLARITAVRVKKGAGIYHATFKPLMLMSVVLILFYVVNLGFIKVLTLARVPGDTALFVALLIDDVLATMWLMLLYRRNTMNKAGAGG
jgi:hypothetical protein